MVFCQKSFVRNPNSFDEKVIESHSPYHQHEKSEMLEVDHRVVSCLFLVELEECCEKSYSCNLAKGKCLCENHSLEIKPDLDSFRTRCRKCHDSTRNCVVIS